MEPMKTVAVLLLAASAAVGAGAPEHKLVYREAGRFGGWPANHGIWSWGDEILVGFSAAWHKSQPSDRHQQDHDKPEEPRLARTLDGGETWTIESPRDLLPPAQGGREPQDLKQPMDFERPGFAMTIRFLDTNTGPSLLWYTYDKGKSWKGPFRFPQFGRGVAARTDYLINGNRDAMVFLTAAKSNGREGRPFCARTTDGGLSWNFVSYIGEEPAGFAIMPSTVRLSGPRLLTLVRVHDGASNRIDAYESEDGGSTWRFKTTVADTGAFGGNPPMLLKLRDGRLCVTYGYRAKPYSILARLSADGGNTWSDPVVIREGASTWEVGYTRSAQRRDGRIVTVYYFNDGPHNERFIESTVWSPPPPASDAIDLSTATVVSRPGDIAATVLVEELQKRTGIRLNTSATLPGGKPAIEIDAAASGIAAEGYHLYADHSGTAAVVRVSGADGRGELYGVGQLLRRLDWARGEIRLQVPLDITTAPKYSIRGHQLGYRAQANSYDAWNAAQFEQYIRELTFFGVNSIEGIPLQDDRSTPVMKTPRREMNRAIGEICKRYGLDYWAWIPVEFDLNDRARRAKMLDECRQFFDDTPELTAVFFPGGDPGHNPPELVLPFLEDMAKILRVSHPNAKVWLSLQWFTPQQVDHIYDYIDRTAPKWFGGLVGGPSSPPLAETRRRLPKQYKLRDYPDLTHNKLCQYQVPSWDQAYALTLGREAVNPRPAEFALIHNRLAAYTDGFISYSDGVHDDVNKTIWSALSWDPSADVRQILTDYARVYFKPAVARDAADGILALERNWRGPLADNGAVEGTLLQWRDLERAAPDLENNWRWQMCLLRANYDAYVRRRLLNETTLENEADAVMARAAETGSGGAMEKATAILERAATQPVSAGLRARIVELCDELFHSIGLQTSVPKYFAIGEERGAVLDFVDYPLNNRWWLEDQFKAIRQLGSESEKCDRLIAFAKWEHPGQGSFYDDVGNIAKSPHVVRVSSETAPETAREPEPTFWWWDQGFSRARLSWQVTMWPAAMVYEGLDPNKSYVVRCSGAGQALLRMDGERVEASSTRNEFGTQIKEFPVAPNYVKDRKLVLTFDRPVNEGGLNWRQRSRLAEVWLIAK